VPEMTGNINVCSLVISINSPFSDKPSSNDRRRQKHKKRRHRKNRKKAQNNNNEYRLVNNTNDKRTMPPYDDLFIEPAGEHDIVYGNNSS
jgi:hypothetical protein